MRICSLAAHLLNAACLLAVAPLQRASSVSAQRCEAKTKTLTQLRFGALALIPRSAPELGTSAGALLVSAQGFYPLPVSSIQAADSARARRISGAISFELDRRTGVLRREIPAPPGISFDSSPIVHRLRDGDVVAAWREVQGNRTSSAYSMRVARFRKGRWSRIADLSGFDFVPLFVGDHAVLEQNGIALIAFSAIRDSKSGVALIAVDGGFVDSQFITAGTLVPPRAVSITRDSRGFSIVYESRDQVSTTHSTIAQTSVRVSRGKLSIGGTLAHAVEGASSVLSISRISTIDRAGAWTFLVRMPTGKLEVRYRGSLPDSIEQRIRLEESEVFLVGAGSEVSHVALLWVEGAEPQLRIVGLLDGQTFTAVGLDVPSGIVQPPLLVGGLEREGELVLTILPREVSEKTNRRTGMLRISFSTSCNGQTDEKKTTNRNGTGHDRMWFRRSDRSDRLNENDG